MRTLMQTLTFTRKEITDAFHQPRLLLTLVLGPFLIMAAFGLGYRESPKPLRTMVVIADSSPLKADLDKYVQQLSSYVHVVGVTPDANHASSELQHGKVDVVVTFPTSPLDDVLANHQSQITIVHTRLDPIQRTAISYASTIAVDQINGAVLASVIGAGQSSAGQPLDQALTAADAAAQRLDTAVAAHDANTINSAVGELDGLAPRITALAHQTADLVARVGGTGDQADRATQLNTQVDQLAATIAQIHQDGANVDQGTIQQLRSSTATIRNDFNTLSAVDPNVLAQPFKPDVQLAVPGLHKITDWYAPAAIVLILQQFGVAFGALTFVRERQLGINDVLRVAPVNAMPALVGKYLAYLLLGGAMGAALTALVVKALDVPIAGSTGEIAAVMALTLFASIGLGFVISLVSRTDAQAVQYALLVLLASLFFSGFFLSLDQMRGAAQYIAWLLPVSYGMGMLRDVMLVGTDPSPRHLAGLGAFGVAMFLLALLGAHRRMNATPS